MGRFCSRFGGEGSGSHCERAVDLFKGREYSFHVEVSERNSSGTGWHASIIDEFSAQDQTGFGVLLNSLVFDHPLHPSNKT